MDPKIVIPEIAAMAAAFVFLPVVACAMSDARRPHGVECPENGQRVTVRLDPARTVLNLFAGSRQRVSACTRWPERAGCDRGCEPSIPSW